MLPEHINGNVIVRPTWEMAKKGMQRWENTAVGYFIGKKLPFMAVKTYVFSVWKGLKEVKATSNGFYFFKFESEKSMSEVLEGGPWLYAGQPIFLQKWKEGMSLDKQNHKEVPIWVKFRNIPTEYWTDDGLSIVASAVGRPLYPDAYTSSMERLDYARVCIVVDIHSKFRDHMYMLLPSEDGDYNGSCKIAIEYEWLPKICSSCKSFGHVDGDCPLMKKAVQRPKPVHIYIPKSKVGDGCKVPMQIHVPKSKVNEWEVVQKKKRKGVVENERELVKVGDRVNDIPESSNAFALLDNLEDGESDRDDLEDGEVRGADLVRIRDIGVGNDLDDANELFRDVERECADLRGPMAAPLEGVK